MKKLTLVIATAAVALFLAGSTAKAVSASGTLAVTATVTSQIYMTFDTDASGVPLTGSGSNAATLPFGSVSAFSAPPANVTLTLQATTFTISTPVDVNVRISNPTATSPNCTLKAQLASADATNNWTVGGIAVTSASAATISSTLAYQTGSTTTGGVSEAVAIAVPYTEAATTISNTINFTATSN
ncbi:MAG: hypothetical protein ABSF45_26695 [Terriglobia bacterium]|jgi:hypothetical protein